MPKFIVIFDNGYGEMAETVEAKDQNDAEDKAYDLAKEDWENQANYRAEPWSKEEAENYGIEDE